MAAPVRTRARAIKVFLFYIGALALLAVLMATDIWWLDTAYVSVAFALLVAFSVRTLFSKWRSDEAHDVTKHGPGAAYPKSWRCWLTDDYPADKSR